MLFTVDGREEEIGANVDRFGDSFARQTDVEELREVRIQELWKSLRDLTFPPRSFRIWGKPSQNQTITLTPPHYKE